MLATDFEGFDLVQMGLLLTFRLDIRACYHRKEKMVKTRHHSEGVGGAVEKEKEMRTQQMRTQFRILPSSRDDSRNSIAWVVPLVGVSYRLKLGLLETRPSLQTCKRELWPMDDNELWRLRADVRRTNSVH